MLDTCVTARPTVLTEPGATPDAAPNSIGATLGLLGDEWSLLIVRYAFSGARRYGDWKQQLAISDAVLAARLRALVDAGVLRRVPSPTTHRHEYTLTSSGLDLWQLLLCIWAWERHHVEGQSSRLPHMVHATCGERFHPVLRCARCKTPTSTDDVHATFGPSGSFERSVPAGNNRRRLASRRSPNGHGRGMFPETMAIIGSRWSSATLGAAFLGATRFSEFERLLGAPPNVVADRLKSFVALGVFEHDRHIGSERATYHLSAKGRAFFGVVASFVAWAERWMPAADGPAVVAVHRGCGGPFFPDLACSACDRSMTRETLTISD